MQSIFSRVFQRNYQRYVEADIRGLQRRFTRITTLSALMDRQKSILEAAILEYIRSAKPVASRELAGDYRFGVSPATIRNELSELDKLGYLEQPHTSSGRIPTDLGYRFFVDNLVAEYGLTAGEKRLIRRVFAGERRAEDFMREFSKCLAHLAGSFSMVGIQDEDFFYESGFSEIMEEPEFNSQEAVRAFSRLADCLDEDIAGLLDAYDLDDSEQFLIGSENPLKEARLYTMILSSWRHPRGFEGFLAIVSPRRTNYARHKAILNTIKHAQ